MLSCGRQAHVASQHDQSLDQSLRLFIYTFVCTVKCEDVSLDPLPAKTAQSSPAKADRDRFGEQRRPELSLHLDIVLYLTVSRPVRPDRTHPRHAQIVIWRSEGSDEALTSDSPHLTFYPPTRPPWRPSARCRSSPPLHPTIRPYYRSLRPTRQKTTARPMEIPTVGYCRSTRRRAARRLEWPAPRRRHCQITLQGLAAP